MKFGKNEGVANKAISLATDPFICSLKKQKNAVEFAIKYTDNDTRTIIERRMFRRYPDKAFKIASDLDISPTTVYRRTDDFIKIVADILKN